MNDDDRRDVSEAIASVIASSAIGTLGVVALCAELTTAGLLSREAGQRIAAFLAASVKSSGASPPAQRQLLEMLKTQFGSLPEGPQTAQRH